MSVQSAIYSLLWINDFEDKTPSKSLIARITREWEAFQKTWETIGFKPEEHRLTSFNLVDGDLIAHVAHDWIMTRCETGCGFCDGDWDKEIGNKLTEICEKTGKIEVYCSRGYVYCHSSVYLKQIASRAIFKREGEILKIQIPEIDSYWRKVENSYVNLKGELICVPSKILNGNWHLIDSEPVEICLR